MNTQTSILLQLFNEANTRFTNQLEAITETDLKKRLGSSPNSVGFLIRHVGDVNLLFAKNVFNASDVDVNAQTVIKQKDTGEWTNLPELKKYVRYSLATLKFIAQQQKDQDWLQQVTTQQFGTKYKSEALGRIISHTAYHAGQIALITKYGNN